uniref:Uncharacterized protein n=1 Tax=Physcomitrium patens TaxID=3218 RepID=A0A2K1K3E7_PHYPA|nr:hypothetical protein PHYPA_012781 [Physcomitrium patens]
MRDISQASIVLTFALSFRMFQAPHQSNSKRDIITEVSPVLVPSLFYLIYPSCFHDTLSEVLQRTENAISSILPSFSK